MLWVLVTASALHVVEEHAMGWQGWAAQEIGPRIGVIPTWTDFWATKRAGRPNPGSSPRLSLLLGAMAMAAAVVMLILGSRLG